MTKYILEGGNYKKSPELMRAFFNEALKNLGSNPIILWCFFATEQEERNLRFKQFRDVVSDVYTDGVEPIHLEATEDKFEQQVVNADLINIQGGSTDILRDALKRFDLEKLFQNKVVGGHSAGAQILAKEFWSPGLRKFGTGFDILPIKTLTHYNSHYGEDDPRGPIDWEAAKAELEAYGETSLPIYALKEGEFVVFEK